MSVSNSYLQYVMEQFEQVTEVRSRKMFGGAGIYHNDIMFALLSSDDVLYLRTDDSNRPDFADAGMSQFMTMPYFQLPIEALEDTEQLSPWLQKAITASVNAKKKKKKK